MVQFVSVASGGLSGELKKSDSATRKQLVDMVEDIVKLDPEFILKVKNFWHFYYHLHYFAGCYLLPQRTKLEAYIKSFTGFKCQKSQNKSVSQEIFPQYMSDARRLDHGCKLVPDRQH